MTIDAYDKASAVTAIEGEVTVVGPGATGMSITPDAARRTAQRLQDAAAQAESGHVEQIDPDDQAAVARWARRLGVDADAVRNAAIAVGGASDAVALRLDSARGAAD